MPSDDLYFQDPALSERIASTSHIIFDMNGLIIDDEPVQKQASNQVFETYDIHFTDQDWSEKIVGHKPAEWMPSFLPEHVDVAGVIAQKDRAYQEIIASQIRDLVRPGFLDLLRWGQTQNRPIALATGTTREEMNFILGPDGLNIRQEFDFLICGDEVSRSKPNPEIYHAVRAHFGEDAHHFLVFEDTPIGAMAATRAGMSVVAVPNRYTLKKSFPDGVVKADSMACDAQILEG